MNLGSSKSQTAVIAIPHASGDEPDQDAYYRTPGGQFPTRVGMNRAVEKGTPRAPTNSPREWG